MSCFQEALLLLRRWDFLKVWSQWTPQAWCFGTCLRDMVEAPKAEATCSYMLEFHLAKYNFSIWCIIGFDLRFVFFVFSLKSHAPARRLVETPWDFQDTLLLPHVFVPLCFRPLNWPRAQAQKHEMTRKSWNTQSCAFCQICSWCVSVVSESLQQLKLVLWHPWELHHFSVTHMQMNSRFEPDSQANRDFEARRPGWWATFSQKCWCHLPKHDFLKEDDQSWQTVWKGATGCQSQKGCYFLVACLLHSRNLEDITKNVRDQR